MHRTSVLLALAALAALAAPGAARADTHGSRPIGDSRVIADLPNPPGFPEGIAIKGNKFYVSTQAHFGTVGAGPSQVLSYDLKSGALLRTYVIAGEDPGQEHGLSGIAFDGDGRLYVLSTQLGVLRLDLETGAQEAYAPPLPFIGTGFPLANDLAFDDLGYLYITDSFQGAIWRVPPGGGSNDLWFLDARLEVPFDAQGNPLGFGPNGLRLSPDRTRVCFIMTLDAEGQGYVYTLPLVDRPVAADLAVLHQFMAGEGPDDMTFGVSGRLYVSLAFGSAISVLGPDGGEVARYAGAAQGADGAVPYDMPSGVVIDDRTGALLANNHAEFSGLSSHMVVFDLIVADHASPLAKPELP
jgi:sugar lactone lactonase YvrE